MKCCCPGEKCSIKMWRQLEPCAVSETTLVALESSIVRGRPLLANNLNGKK